MAERKSGLLGSRKGTVSQETLEYITIWFGMALIIAGSLFVAAFFTINRQLDTEGLDAFIIANRIYYSKTAFSYFDGEINRNYPGVIDTGLLAEPQLRASLGFKDDRYAAINATVQSSDGLVSAVYNKDKYRLWSTIALSGVPGKGSARIVRMVTGVLLQETGKPATYTLTAVVPNE